MTLLVSGMMRMCSTGDSLLQRVQIVDDVQGTFLSILSPTILSSHHEVGDASLLFPPDTAQLHVGALRSVCILFSAE